MKSQFLFVCLFVSLHGFVCGMDGETSETSEIHSGQSTPSRVEYPKIDHGIRSLVFKTTKVGHEIEEVTVIIPIRAQEVGRTQLTQEQCQSAIPAVKKLRSCLKPDESEYK